jgi:dihydroxy-acid dehydratase
MKALGSRIHIDAITVSGQTVGSIVSAATIENTDVIHSDDHPVDAEGSNFILKGSWARGAWL